MEEHKERLALFPPDPLDGGIYLGGCCSNVLPKILEVGSIESACEQPLPERSSMREVVELLEALSESPGGS
jgi:hypothetical protein